MKTKQRKGLARNTIDKFYTKPNIAKLCSNALKKHIKSETTFKDFFKQAKLHKNAKLITGTICGVKIEDIEEPLMKKIRYLDKIVDELAKGRPMEKILRKKD